MKVNELINKLKELDPLLEVFIPHPILSDRLAVNPNQLTIVTVDSDGSYYLGDIRSYIKESDLKLGCFIESTKG